MVELRSSSKTVSSSSGPVEDRDDDMEAGDASRFRIPKKLRGDAREPEGSEEVRLDDWAEAEEEFEVVELVLEDRTLRHRFFAPFVASSPRSTASALS